MRVAFVAETTIREANDLIWGNHHVAGLGSQPDPRSKFIGNTGDLVGMYKFILPAVS